MSASQRSVNVHKHAFWLYGVIIGLVIKDSVANVSDHIFLLPPKVGETFHKQVADQLHIPFADSSIITSQTRWADTIRLLAVLILCIRFYLGAAVYFETTYLTNDGKPKEDASDTSYMLDFVIGFVHFLLFLGLSTTIEVHREPVIAFPIVLSVILLYDLLWWVLIARKNDRHRLVARWSVINSFTVILGGLFYFGTFSFKRDKILAEQLALIPVILLSIFDILETIMGRELIKIFGDWLTKKPKEEEEEEEEEVKQKEGTTNPLISAQPNLHSETNSTSPVLVAQLSIEPSHLPPGNTDTQSSLKCLGNKKRRLYHLPKCQAARGLGAENLEYFDNESAAESAGYKLAEKCAECSKLRRSR